MCSLSPDFSEDMVSSFSFPPSPTPSYLLLENGLSNSDLNQLCRGITDGDLLASEIDEFSSMFLPTTISGSLGYSPSWTKVSQSCALRSSSSASSVKEMFSFDQLNMDNLDSSYLFDQSLLELGIKIEKPLSLVTSSSSLQSSSSSSSSSTSLMVPSIPLPQPLELSTAYYAQAVPKEPGLFVASQLRGQSGGGSKLSKPKGTTKRKRRDIAVVDEECDSDGVLFNILMEACERNKIPCLSKTSTSDELKDISAKRNRLATKLKLELKKRNRKLNFNGHYPERKAVACARKRVGGRFVKEKKSVFRPV